MADINMEVMSVIGGAGYEDGLDQRALSRERFPGFEKNRTLIRVERGFWAEEKSMRWCWGLSVLLHGLLWVVFYWGISFLRLRGLIQSPKPLLLETTKKGRAS